MKHWLEWGLEFFLTVWGISLVAIVCLILYGMCALIEHLSKWVASQPHCVGGDIGFSCDVWVGSVVGDERKARG